MSVILKYNSGLESGDSDSVDRSYLITASSDSDAYGQLIAHADCPATLPGATVTLYRGRVAVNHVGNDNYEAAASWGFATRYAGVSFSTTGGQTLVTQSLNTSRYGSGAVDHLGQIGVTKNGVEGVQITVPQFQWSESHILDNATVSSGYVDSLANMTGTTNNASWRGMPTGEVLFLGASGERRTADDWSLTFSFARSPNATGLAVGAITGVAKGGWDYLWVKYVDEVDSGTAQLIRKPVGVYVERVYSRSTFTDLGIS